MAAVSCINPHLQDLTVLHEGYVWSSIIVSSVEALAPLKGLRRLETTWETFISRGDINKETENFPSVQSLVDAIPPSLEQLCISGGPYLTKNHHDIAMAVIFKLLEQKHRHPALKTLDFGWKKGRQPDTTMMNKSRYHRGFTEEDHLEVMTRCQGAGVELILKCDITTPEVYLLLCG